MGINNRMNLSVLIVWEFHVNLWKPMLYAWCGVMSEASECSGPIIISQSQVNLIYIYNDNCNCNNGAILYRGVIAQALDTHKHNTH